MNEKRDLKEHDVIINNNKYQFTHSKTNIGLCSSIKEASKLIKNQYVLYAHDDMYFCKNWDIFLTDEINKQDNNSYYLTGTNVSTRHGLINFDCGSTYLDFDEKKFQDFCLQDQTPDLQSSHWAPHLIHKELWDQIGGFSEEFNPGDGSDPDFCMKLWKQNVRIFKGVSKFKNIGDLKHKESNRLLESKKILVQAGIKCKTTKDSIIIYGQSKIETQNKLILTKTKGDHRICMSSVIFSLVTGMRAKIKNFETVYTSSPSFLKIMKS